MHAMRRTAFLALLGCLICQLAVGLFPRSTASTVDIHTPSAASEAAAPASEGPTSSSDRTRAHHASAWRFTLTHGAPVANSANQLARGPHGLHLVPESSRVVPTRARHPQHHISPLAVTLRI